MATTKDRLDELTTHERELEDHEVVALADRGVVDAQVPPAAAGNGPAAAVLLTSLRGRLLEPLSGRWAAIGAVAWVVLLGIGIAVEPQPTNPNAVDPWDLNVLGTVLLAAVVAALAGFWLRRRWSMAASLLASGLLLGALVRPPGPVLDPAAVGDDFPRHRGGGFPQPGGDHGKGLPGMHAQGDLLPVGQGQPPRSWHPVVPPDRPLRAARAISATP